MADNHEHSLPAAFPISLTDAMRKLYPLCPESVPYRFLKGTERRAEKNHRATLIELALDGGLDPLEIVSLLNDQPPPHIADVKRHGQRMLSESVAELVRRLAEWSRRPGNTPVAEVKLVPAWTCEFCGADNVVSIPIPDQVRCWMCRQWFSPVCAAGVGDDYGTEETGSGEPAGEGPTARRAGQGD